MFVVIDEVETDNCGHWWKNGKAKTKEGTVGKGRNLLKF
jgi:hypothetical protein